MSDTAPCGARWEVKERGLKITPHGVELLEDLVLRCPDCGHEINWSVVRERWEAERAQMPATETTPHHTG